MLKMYFLKTGTTQPNQSWTHTLFIICLLLLANFLSEPSHAQETNLTASGLETVISGQARIESGKFYYDITGGSIEGKNLFHSFSDFSLAKDHVAYFSNNGQSEINNIISRVTQNPSQIDGEINTREFGQANLFLINPKGIIFGETAKLDIGGSFYASTANVLHFEDEKIFHTDSGRTVYLSSAVPTAFGFLDEIAKPIISHQNKLRLDDGKTLYLAGGGIDINGSDLRTDGGQITLLSRTDAEGKTPLNVADGMSDDYRGIGRITIKNGAKIRVRDEGGSLYIRASEFILEGIDPESTKTTTLEAKISKVDNQQAEINIEATDITIKNNATIKIFLTKENNQGKISIKAQRISLKDNGRIEYIAEGTGNSGGIDLTIDDRLALEQGGRIVSNSSVKNVSGGDIVISARQADILISGSLGESVSEINASAADGGMAGDISITASSLEINDSAKIQATSSGFGDRDEQGNSKARAGDITLTLDVLRVNQGGNIINKTSGDGAGGTIAITADYIEITGQGQNQAQVSPSGDDGSNIQAEINANTSDTGTGGDIIINTDNIDITNGGKILAQSSSKNSNLLDDPTIAQSGSITINASDRFTMDSQSQVSLSTEQANAGDIEIRADNLFYLNDSTISTSVAGGEGSGGNITINDNVHENLVVTTGASNILATTQQGQGGNININAYSHIIFSDTVIDASSEQGINGQVSIVKPEVDATVGLLALPELYLDVSGLLDNRCLSRTASNQSRFVVSSRDGLAPTPDTLLASRLSNFDIPINAPHAEQQPTRTLRLSNLAPSVNCL